MKLTVGMVLKPVAVNSDQLQLLVVSVLLARIQVV